MVNGRPNLTFGGSVPVAGTARQRSVGGQDGRTRVAGDFASLLPQATQAFGNNQTANAPAPAARQAQAVPQNVRQNVPAPQAKLYTGMLPDNYVSARMQGMQTAGNYSGSMPAGQYSLAAARSRPAPVPTPAAGGTQAQPAHQVQRVSVKTLPRISSRPVTGRRDIGMEDTRQSAQGRSTLSGSGRPAHATPTANAAHAQSLGFGRQGGPLPAQAGQARVAPIAAMPSHGAYAGFSVQHAGLAGDHIGQSFLSVGFAGKHAGRALERLGYNMQAPESINTHARLVGADPYGLNAGMAAPSAGNRGGANTARFNSGDEAARMAVRTAGHKRKGTQGAAAARSMVPSFQGLAENGLGTLAAKFESGADGIAAIGYDRTGGTSYGKYQIASRVGTMKNFISYLDENAPDLAQRLRAAGPANTGGRNGRMPAEWRKIAAEEPERFESLQSDFIRSSHFNPAKEGIASATGVSFDALPHALQEVLFSTAVQHGPAGAVRIVNQALKRVGPQKVQSASSETEVKTVGRQLITQIYNLRAGQFGSSSARVQGAVRNRLRQEMQDALHMLA